MAGAYEWIIGTRHLRSTPFRTVVGQDDREPDVYIANIAQGGLARFDPPRVTGLLDML